MQFNTLFFLLILSCVCLTLAQVSYEDCCLKYVRNMSKGTQRHAISYRHQKTDGGCNIPAVIFNMKRGRRYCANPADKWVEELKRVLDEKATKIKKFQRKKHSSRG